MENTKKVYVLMYNEESDGRPLMLTTSYERACMRLLHCARQDHGNELYTYHDYIDVSEYKDLNEQDFYKQLKQKYSDELINEMMRTEDYYSILEEELVED